MDRLHFSKGEARMVIPLLFGQLLGECVPQVCVGLQGQDVNACTRSRRSKCVEQSKIKLPITTTNGQHIQALPCINYEDRLETKLILQKQRFLSDRQSSEQSSIVFDTCNRIYVYTSLLVIFGSCQGT